MPRNLYCTHDFSEIKPEIRQNIRQKQFLTLRGIDYEISKCRFLTYADFYCIHKYSSLQLADLAMMTTGFDKGTRENVKEAS